MATTRGIARLTRGVALGVLVAFATLALATTDVGARPKNVGAQNEWVDLCRENGGSPKSTGPRTVTCTFPNGNSMTCNFRTLVCSVVVVTRQERTASSPSDPLADILPAGFILAAEPPSTSGSLDAPASAPEPAAPIVPLD